MPGAVLITGATGFVGMEVLARWLERSDRSLCVLVRAADERAATERVRSVVEAVCGDPDAHAGRIEPVPADMERPRLGLEQHRLEGLASRVDLIVHCAASVSFTLGLEESRRINVLGTRRMLDLAELCRERGGLERFTYVSTAYVAGTHAGTFAEDDFDVGQRFRNPYEQSKFEAEAEVRSRGGRLPVQVVRPSIVVGERETGWTSSFNVLYTPLKALARGAYKFVPADLSAPVDVVPVDYVADAVFELSSGGGDGTYNLVAGDRATTVGRLARQAARYFGRPVPRTVPAGLYRRLIHPLLVRFSSGRSRRALQRSEAFFPYFSMRVRYDARRARRRLEPAGVRVPSVEGYFDRLLEFATRAQWGRRRLPRPRPR